MNITISGQTASELRQKLIDFVNNFNVLGHDSNQLSFPLGENAQAKPSTEPVTRIGKKKASMKAKAKIEAVEDEDEIPGEDVAVLDEPVQAASHTEEDVRNALKELSVRKNIEAAKELLSKFNCKRVGDLSPDAYSDFISACKAVQ